MRRPVVLLFAVALGLAFVPLSAAGTANAAALKVICIGKVENPHPSSGGTKNVVYKVRVQCTGDSGTVAVKLVGKLSSVSGGSKTAEPLGPAVPRWTENVTQNVAVNGAPKTYYVPRVGVNIYGTAWYYTATTIQIIPGGTVSQLGHTKGYVVSVKP